MAATTGTERGDFEYRNAFIEWYNTVRPPKSLDTKWSSKRLKMLSGVDYRGMQGRGIVDKMYSGENDKR